MVQDLYMYMPAILVDRNKLSYNNINTVNLFAL